MYTATLLGDTNNIELRRRLVNVEFSNGTTTFTKEFSFNINEVSDVIKRAVKSYLDEINLTPPVINGDIATPPPDIPPPAPTQAELDRTLYFSERDKLRTLMELVRDGVFIGSETQITNLQTSVRTKFKSSYLG